MQGNVTTLLQIKCIKNLNIVKHIFQTENHRCTEDQNRLAHEIIQEEIENFTEKTESSRILKASVVSIVYMYDCMGMNTYFNMLLSPVERHFWNN